MNLGGRQGTKIGKNGAGQRWPAMTRAVRVALPKRRERRERKRREKEEEADDGLSFGLIRSNGPAQLKPRWRTVNEDVSHATAVDTTNVDVASRRQPSTHLAYKSCHVY
jgi:hypothetical protein